MFNCFFQFSQVFDAKPVCVENWKKDLLSCLINDNMGVMVLPIKEEGYMMDTHQAPGAVWVLVRTQSPAALEASYELLCPGQGTAFQRGSRLVALVMGSGVEEIAWEAVRYGADSVILLDAPQFQRYQGAVYAQAICKLQEIYHPELLLLSESAENIELARRLSQAWQTEISTSPDALGLQRGRWEAPSGKISYQALGSGTPQIGLIKPKLFCKNSYNAALMGDVVDGMELI